MIFYNAHDIESALLKLVLDTKQIEYTTETVANECAIDDNDLFINDALIAIKYLNERRPKPNLFSTSPEQDARLNMFLVKTLEAYAKNSTNEIIQELEEEVILPLEQDYITGDDLTVIDLALYPILPNTQKWKTYKQRITEYLNNQQKT